MHSPRNDSASTSAEYDFNISSSKYATAWETVAPTRKPRKQFGRTNSQKKEARRRDASRKKSLRRSNSEPIQEMEPVALLFTRGTRSPFGKGSEYQPTKFSKHLRSRSMNSEEPRKAIQKRHSWLGSSSASFRSSSSTLSEAEPENRNPNITNPEASRALFGNPATPDSPLLKSRAPLSSMEEHPKARPRKIRAISNLGDLQRSFSDLAKTADAITTWEDATPTRAASLGFDTFDLENMSSPHGSVSTVGSRKRGVCASLGGVEDIIGSSSSSMSTNEMRRKSKSRIFCPDYAPSLDSIRSLNDTETSKEKKLVHHRQKIEEMLSDDDLDIATHSDDGMSCEDDKSLDEFDGFRVKEKCVSNPPETVRRAPSDFEACVFGAAAARPAKVLSNDDIIQSMTSEEDLEFLIKNLRKAKKSASKTFGKTTTWTVSLPSKWTSERRAKILQWSTQDLGFSMRTGGPSVVFLNIAASRAPKLLEQLESAFSWRRNGNYTESEAGGPPSIIIQLKPKPQTIPQRGHRGSESLESFDDDLIEAVNKLDLSNQAPETTINAASLVRIVTLPTSHDDNQKKTDNKPARHSGEHAANGTDFVSHMHVVSPRLAPQSFNRLSGGIPRWSLESPKVGASALFHRLSGGAPGLPFDIEHRSMCAASPFVPPRSSRSSYAPVECIETPHMTRRACWERPKTSRDWGATARCSEDIIHVLTLRFECALAELGERLEDQSESFFFEDNLGIDRAMEEVDEEDADTVTGDDEIDHFDFELVDSDDPRKDSDRRSSVGAAEFASLNLNEIVNEADKIIRRRIGSMAKHKRVSLCANTLSTIRTSRSSYFAVAPRLSIMESTLALTDNNRFSFIPVKGIPIEQPPALVEEEDALSTSNVLLAIFSFLDEKELLLHVMPVNTCWADVGTEAHATLMLSSVGCTNANGADVRNDVDDDDDRRNDAIMSSMQQSWQYLMKQYPWACFLSEGAFKKVYKVWNASTQAEEAVSVMDIDLIESTGNKNVVGAELAVSAMVSSLVRRNISPNFVLTRRVFTCQYEPPSSHWGCAEAKKPKGGSYSASQYKGRKPREPAKKCQGNFQYMRMELCSEGDAEEFLKRQPNESISVDDARSLIFQIAFALHAAADRFSLKHYDMKLLNVFLQKPDVNDSEFTTMRYGLGSHVFAIRSRAEHAIIAKLADFGTANVQPESNGQPATIGQFTTLENTPPEFMILGDAATQGHCHDAFGLGLCLLHLFTGHAPYEEILEDVKCPASLKRNLKAIWENEQLEGYSVLQSVILADVYKDEEGEVIEGEPDEVLYDTLYRYLVLFGIPEIKYKMKEHSNVWKAITSALEGGTKKARTYGRSQNVKKGPDAAQFEKDQSRYSIMCGKNDYIARARKALEETDGALELLFSLVEFDPEKRATACDVLNSQFMIPLREIHSQEHLNDPNNHVTSYMAYLTENAITR